MRDLSYVLLLEQKPRQSGVKLKSAAVCIFTRFPLRLVGTGVQALQLIRFTDTKLREC